MRRNLFLLFILCIVPNAILYAQTLAFPGAEGFARYTTGGRGGEVYYVTNLNDSGTGSFRDAVSKPNRIVLFDVGGVIKISTRIVISRNVTVAGQTAPGGGITIYGNGIAFNDASGNNIIRYIRFRMGAGGDSGKDAVGISAGQNYMFDHVSISWGRDGTLDVNGTNIDNLTFQDCIIGQGINNSNHSTGGLMQSGKWSIIRSLYIDNKTRNPKARGTQEFINSVLYNWGTNGYIMGDTDGLSECNLIGNYFIYGPSSSSNSHITNTTTAFRVYASDNWVDSNKDGVLNGTLLTDYKTATVMPSPYSYPGVGNLMSAHNALNHIVANVGASKVRDAVDELLINQLTSYGSQGAIINTEADNSIPGNVGSVASGLAPIDTDRDGMPDAWEIEYGTNPNVKDHNGDVDGDGYTNIEEYLEWIIPNSIQSLTPINEDLKIQEYETGFCNVEGTIDSNNAGFTGNGFANTTNASGAGINWYFAGSNGNHTLTWRYANGGSADRPGKLIVNGVQRGFISFPATGSWTTWNTLSTSVNLPDGVYNVRLEATTTGGLANIDYMEVEGPDAAIVGCGTEVTYPAVLVKHGEGSSSQTVDKNTVITSFSYFWDNAITVEVEGLPSGISTAINAGAKTVTISGTPTEAGVFDYSITTVGGIPNASATGTFTVNEVYLPAELVKHGEGSSSQTINLGENIVDFYYNWVNANSVIVTGVPQGLTVVVNNSEKRVSLSGKPNEAGTFPYTIVTDGGFPEATKGGTITVKAPAVLIKGGSGNHSQTIQKGTAIEPFFFTWQFANTLIVSGLPEGIFVFIDETNKKVSIGGTPTQAGTFAYTLTTTGGNPNTSVQGILTVNVLPAALIKGGSGVQSQTVNKGTAIEPFFFTWQFANTLIVSGLPEGIFVSIDNENKKVTFSGIASQTGTYHYSIVTQGGAPEAEASGTFTVNELAATLIKGGSGAQSQTVNKGTAIEPFYFVWSDATGVIGTGLPAGVIATIDETNKKVSIGGTPTQAGTFAYTLTTTGGNPNTSVQGILTVNVLPAALIKGGSGVQSQTVNKGTAIEPFYFVWSDAIGVVVTGLPAGVIATIDETNKKVTLSGTPSQAGTFTYLLATTGGEPNTSVQGILTVNVLPAALIKGGSGAQSQTVNKGTAIEPFYFVWSEATGVIVTGLPAGVIATIDETNKKVTLSGTPSQAGTFTYLLATTGGEPNTSVQGSIVVDEPFVWLTIEENTMGFCRFNGSISAQNTGFTGIGYALFDKGKDAIVEWAVIATTSETIQLKFRYSNGLSNQIKAEVFLGTFRKEVVFAPTGDWNKWAETEQIKIENAPSGNITIKLSATTGSGLPCLDNLSILGTNLVTANCPIYEDIVKGEVHSVHIFPNPTSSGSFQISNLIKTERTQVKVLDASGKLVCLEISTGKEQFYSTKILRSGLYIIQVMSDSVFHTEKLVVE